MTTPKDELLFLALGGSNEIGMNVNLYGCQGKWVMVDLGITFANAEYPGVELVLPDLEFIEDRKADLLGIVLTHGHEDHIGAVAYFAADLGVPLYATPFTATLIRGKLVEEGIDDLVELNVIPMEGSFTLGPFGFRFVTLAHSILEMSACLIDTPYGRVFHTGDWKLDEQPVIGRPTTAAQLTAIGDDGVLALVCDSTNAFNAGDSGSEGSVKADLVAAVKAARGSRHDLRLQRRAPADAGRGRARNGAQTLLCRTLAASDHRGSASQWLSKGHATVGRYGSGRWSAASRGDGCCHRRARGGSCSTGAHCRG
jgi:ribonuclease J